MKKKKIKKQETHNKLKKIRDEGRKKVIQKILEAKPDSLMDTIQWWSTSEKMVALRGRKMVNLIGLFLAPFLLLMIALSILYRVNEVNLYLELRAESVRFQLREKWEFRDSLPVKKLSLDSLESLSSEDFPSTLNKKGQLGNPLQITAEGETLNLNHFSFPQGGKLALQVPEQEKNSPQQIGLFFQEMQWGGEFYLEKGMIRISQKGVDPDIQKTEEEAFVEFNTIPLEKTSGVLNLTLEKRWQFRDFKIKDIEWTQEIIPGSGKFQSSILDGVIKIHETGKEETLIAGEELTIKNIGRNARIHLMKREENDGFIVRFKGTAGEVFLGPTDTPRFLSPTLLEYYFHWQPLVVLFGALSSLLGIWWSVRSIFTKIW